jgi:hypothetical protein
MLNNLTDCEDGDGGANPGKQWSGGGGRGGGEERRKLWDKRRIGGRLLQKEPRTDPGGGRLRRPGASLYWNALGTVRGAGMRRARGQNWGHRACHYPRPGGRLE